METYVHEVGREYFSSADLQELYSDRTLNLIRDKSKWSSERNKDRPKTSISRVQQFDLDSQSATLSRFLISF